MDDEKVTEFLKSLPTRNAPPEMDKHVLSAVEEVLHGRTSLLGWRAVLYAIAAAAAVMLTTVAVTFRAHTPVRRTLPDGVVARAPAARVGAKTSSEKVAARAALLELKLSRLRQLARFSENKSRHLSNLESLQKELEDITSRISETETPKEKSGGESLVPTKEGGRRYVEDGGGTFGCVPVCGSLRRAGRG